MSGLKRTDYENYPKCPFCGYEHVNSWEWDFDDEGYETDCEKCEKPIEVFKNIEVTFTTFEVKSTEGK